MQVELFPKPKGKVRQGNALSTSAQKMDLNEKRLIFLAMGQIKRSDTELLTQDIYISEIAQWLGGNPYQEAQKAADGLLKRVVFIQGDDGSYKKFQWTTLSEYIPASKSKDGQAQIRIRLNEELKPLLVQLKNHFNSIPLAELLPIPSFNSQRLYEILWADSYGGQRTVLTYEIKQLKIILGLMDPDGKNEKYASWRDFKKVLNRAKKDFEEYGVLRISSYKGQRQRSQRSFSSVLFSLHLTSTKSQAQDVQRSSEEQEIARALTEAGYVQDPFKAIDQYGLQLVRNTLKLARKTEAKANTSSRPIKNLGGLIAFMLREGAAEHYGDTDHVIDLNKMAASINLDFADARTAYASTLWKAMTPDERDALHDQMRVVMTPFTLERVDKADWSGSLYEAARNNLLLDQNTLPEHLEDITVFVKHENFFGGVPDDKQADLLKLIREKA